MTQANNPNQYPYNNPNTTAPAGATPPIPPTGQKPKKAWYKKWWIWVIVVIAIIILASALGGNKGKTETKSATTPAQSETVVAPVETTPTPETAEPKPVETTSEPAKPAEPEVPTEYKSALTKAELYASTMYMSKAGIYDQLTSDYGEGFAPEAAQYAVDTLQWDYNANALKKAETYQSEMAMSPSAIYDQLVSEYGEKFTPEEAQYAIDNLS